MNDRTNERTNHERSDERSDERTTMNRWTNNRMNNRMILVLVLCLCGSGSGGEVSCHEMAWGGLRGGPRPSIYRQGGRIRGRRRGLVEGCED
jgi:hypothetical protein